MHKLLIFFRSKPFFLLLLPLFFVFHGFTENFNAIPAFAALSLAGVYIAASLIIFFTGWLCYRNISKAAILSFCIMAFHFFFGTIQDTLKKLFGEIFFTRYVFLLPFILSVFIIIIIGLKKSKSSFTKLSLFLNTLLCLLIVMDAAWLVQRSFSKNNSPFSKYIPVVNCDTCTKPDIYLLLFDEYSSSTALKELWSFDNNGLDSFLLKKGFSIQSLSRSNYNFTEFSMASALNMDYLSIPDPKACTIKDYNQCFDLIRKNQVCEFLESIGYRIVNNSIFDLSKNPSPVTEDFLPLKTKLITSQTFLSRLQKDLYYHLLVGKFAIPFLAKNLVYRTGHNNEKIINATMKESVQPSPFPRFIYSHIEMPHPPFYYTGNGKQTNMKKLIEESKNLTPSSYLAYIPRTNEVIKQLVNSIINNAKRPVVIILLGDHGFRTQQPEIYHFRNQNAVYFSFTDQNKFYPAISNVNEFRVLFNTLFQTSYPLLKDSAIYLTDKK